MTKRDSPGPSSSEPPRKRPLNTDVNGKPRFRGCDSIKAYDILEKLGEGTFGEVHKARHRSTNHLVALKKILMHNAKEDGFPITSLREIKILKALSHKNVIRLMEMAVEQERGPATRGTLYMVFPYMHHDLAGLLENPDVTFSEPQIKCYMIQLLEGTKYLHQVFILNFLHSVFDNPGMGIGGSGLTLGNAANLLIDNRGILQIADFGLARKFEEPVPVPGGGGGVADRDYTNCVVTRWYRPPELLLGERKYTSAIDLWGVGCVFAEMYRGRPILQGNTDMDQVIKIFQLCGSPTQKNMPGFDKLPGCEGMKSFGPFQRTLEGHYSSMGSAGVSLLSQLLKLDPQRRINAMDALKHEYFATDPLPAKPSDLPSFEDSHELDRKKFRHQKAHLPPAPAGGTVGIGQDGTWGWSGRAGEVPWANGSGAGPSRGGRPNNDPWANGGSQRYGRQHDNRLPPHDSRVPPGHRPGPDHRQWSRPGGLDHRELGLPPRPPQVGHMDREPRGPPPRTNRGNGGGNVDTYIPSYGVGGPDDRRGNWSRDWDRDRGDRDRGDRGDRGDRRDRGHDRGYNGGIQRRSSSRDRHREEPANNIYRR
ncbi:Pkinase-domain-containing protein [Tuber magnatum]|uniref:Pkinase-domain-containing protein n=1 Tax=Tuber magnatum TaxID=42249 RepID=A0A317T156_9PEZI|nr:Pkinase-domain-containing protein [Tuber magnatum]